MVERTITGTIAADPACGVAIWAPRRLRDIEGFQATTRRLDDNADPVDQNAAVALDGLASRFARDSANERARGVKTLILSEENLMGGMRNNFRTSSFYGDVARRLASFDTVLPLSPRRIAIGARDYGAVWTSAYQYLPQSGHTPPPVELVREALMSSKRGWPDVVADVRAVWPDSEIVMWQQEHLNHGLAAICGQISGLKAKGIVVPDGKINARTTASNDNAVFTPNQRQRLQHRYHRHLAVMHGMDGVTWVGAPTSADQLS